MIKFLKRYKWRILILSLIAPVILFFIWREYRVWRIPDIGEPFDVEAFLKEYRDPEKDALKIYIEAGKLYTPLEEISPNALKQTDTDLSFLFLDKTPDQEKHNLSVAMYDWRYAEPLVQDYLKANLAGLNLFQEGTSKKFATNILPIKIQSLLNEEQVKTSESSDQSPTTNNFSFRNIALFRAAQLVDQGDLEGAWACHQCLLRHEIQLANSHSRVVEYLYSPSRTLIMSHSLLGQFLANENLTAEDLRKIYQEVIDLSQTLPPASSFYKMDYLRFKSDLKTINKKKNDPEEKLLLYLNELEVFKRLVALWTHAQLQQCDLPTDNRPEMKTIVFQPFMPSINPLGLEPGKLTCYPFQGEYKINEVSYTQNDLEATYRALILDDMGLQFPRSDPEESLNIIRKEILMDLLMIALQCYHREQGKFPERLEQLVPDYIEELPGNPANHNQPFGYEVNAGRVKLISTEEEQPRQVIIPGTKYVRPPAKAER